VNDDAWVAWIKQALGEYREVQPYLYGDFYPLLPYSLGEETWTACNGIVQSRKMV